MTKAITAILEVNKFDVALSKSKLRKWGRTQSSSYEVENVTFELGFFLFGILARIGRILKAAIK